MAETSRMAPPHEIVPKALHIWSDRLSTWMEIAAGAALIGVMLLTGSDIVGRIFGRPIPGAYEIVSIAGGLIIGLAMPCTSRAKAHVFTDLLLTKLPDGIRSAFIVITRLTGILTFSLTGCGMIMMGIRLRAAGEVTAVLSLPFYYIAFVLGGAFLVQVMILISDVGSEVFRSPFPVQSSDSNGERAMGNGGTSP